MKKFYLTITFRIGKKQLTLGLIKRSVNQIMSLKDVKQSQKLIWQLVCDCIKQLQNE